MTKPRFIPLPEFLPVSDEQLKERLTEFRKMMLQRRTVREFSSQPIPRGVIEECLRIAVSAPSGANLQPWHFVAISDPAVKREIRTAAEEEERQFYKERAPAEWLEALRPLGTDWRKPFLEIAPWLIAIFSQPYRLSPKGKKMKHYYATESVGIATGFLISAIHHAGLASLTHTPSPMAFLNRILQRPSFEKPFLLLVVGHPSPRARVPATTRKRRNEMTSFLE